MDILKKLLSDMTFNNPSREEKKARKEEVLRRVKAQLADTKNILKIE